ncbi:MAG: type II secretion system F family protein [Bdellovibrionales bacterium]|nr:type II secretion system F family protein [Bdellovibrionales bacterium]
MSFIITNDWLFIIVFAFSILIFTYSISDRVIAFLYEKSLGQREEVIAIMDKMLLDIDKKKITHILLLTSFGLGFIVFLAFWPNIIVGLIFSFAITFVGWSLPKIVLNNLWESRCNKITNQMVDGLTIMSNGIKAGLSITQSLERVTINMKGPLTQEFKLILNKVRLGMTIEEAFNEFSERIPRSDVQMLVTSINILKETGGNLAETFQTITTTIRERQKVQKKIEAMTSQGMMQGVIITLVPFALLIVFSIVDPNYIMPLFTKPLGWFALFIMLALQIIGGYSMKRIVTIEV